MRMRGAEEGFRRLESGGPASSEGGGPVSNASKQEGDVRSGGERRSPALIVDNDARALPFSPPTPSTLDPPGRTPDAASLPLRRQERRAHRRRHRSRPQQHLPPLPTDSHRSFRLLDCPQGRHVWSTWVAFRLARCVYDWPRTAWTADAGSRQTQGQIGQSLRILGRLDAWTTFPLGGQCQKCAGDDLCAIVAGQSTTTTCSTPSVHWISGKTPAIDVDLV